MIKKGVEGQLLHYYILIGCANKQRNFLYDLKCY